MSADPHLAAASSVATSSPADPAAAATLLEPPLALRVVENVQTVLTALILAFVFRAFFIEPFIIPTGSMAPSLLGTHGTLRCSDCGFEFDFGPETGAAPSDTAASFARETLCPNCRRAEPLDFQRSPVKAGDRILVHKWPFLLEPWLGPRRWDVIVFRDPSDPTQNYIKRLAGLPGEALELIDGDLYVDGQVQRKPRAVQQVLWSPIFDQSLLPVSTAQGDLPGPWEPATLADEGSFGWSGLRERVLRYQPLTTAEQGIEFVTHAGVPYFSDLYAYNQTSSGAVVGDVRLRAELALRGDGRIRLEFARDSARYWLEISGASPRRARLVLQHAHEQAREAEASVPLAEDAPLKVTLAYLDRELCVELRWGAWGVRRLSIEDAVHGERLVALREFIRTTPPRLTLIAQGLHAELARLVIDRDVFYTTRGSDTRRAFPGEPFLLKQDQYFVLGDNSPRSHDSREWFKVGPHLHADLMNEKYNLGTVRADQIVGRAFFVYLPGLLPVGDGGVLRLPDIGRMRFIR